MVDIMHMLTINGEPGRVFEALTTEAGIHGWWTSDVKLDAQVGGRGEFAFYNREITVTIQIQELDPARRVSWKIIDSSEHSWVGTTITFDFRGNGNTIDLLLTQSGFAEADEMYARLNTHWALNLLSFQQYIETGEGEPKS